MLQCPNCKGVNIGTYRMPNGPVWCNDCGFRAEEKEKYNPFEKINEPKTIHKGRWLTLKEFKHWEYVEREVGKEAVNVMAIHDNNLILVEQYRIPVGSRTIELPAGLIGDEQIETAEQAGARELLEETGYEGKNFVTFFRGPSSSGLTNEMVTFIFSDDLEKVEKGGGVDGENIIVHEIPFDQVESFLLDKQMKENCMISPRIFVALYFIKSFDDINK